MLNTSKISLPSQAYFFSFSTLYSNTFLRSYAEKTLTSHSFFEKKKISSSFSFSRLAVERNFSNFVKSYFLLRFFCLFRSYPKWVRSSSRRKRVLCYKRTTRSLQSTVNLFYFWFLLQVHTFKRSESSLVFDPARNSLLYSLEDLGHVGWPKIPASYSLWGKSISVSFNGLNVIFLSYFKFFSSSSFSKNFLLVN